MDFGFSDETLALQETARRFAREEIVPIAPQYDQSGEFPRDVIQKAWELGLSSVSIPEPYGGSGLDMVNSCVITEELAWATNFSGILSAPVFWSTLLMFHPLILMIRSMHIIPSTKSLPYMIKSLYKSPNLLYSTR